MEWIELLQFIKLLGEQDSQTLTQQQITALANQMDKLDAEMSEAFDAINALSGQVDKLTTVIFYALPVVVLLVAWVIYLLVWNQLEHRKVKALEKKLDGFYALAYRCGQDRAELDEALKTFPSGKYTDLLSKISSLNKVEQDKVTARS